MTFLRFFDSSRSSSVSYFVIWSTFYNMWKKRRSVKVSFVYNILLWLNIFKRHDIENLKFVVVIIKYSAQLRQCGSNDEVNDDGRVRWKKKSKNLFAPCSISHFNLSVFVCLVFFGMTHTKTLKTLIRL